MEVCDNTSGEYGSIGYQNQNSIRENGNLKWQAGLSHQRPSNLFGKNIGHYD